MTVEMDTLSALVRNSEEIRQRVEALEQANTKRYQQAERLGRLEQDVKSPPPRPAGDEQQSGTTNGSATNPSPIDHSPKLLERYVEFRTRSWQEDGKVSDWITINPNTGEKTSRPSERKLYRYDIDQEERFIFSVSKSAALYKELLAFCPPGVDGQVELSQNQLVFKDVFTLLHYKGNLEKLKIKADFELENKKSEGDNASATANPKSGGTSEDDLKRVLQEIQVFWELYRLEGHGVGHLKFAEERLEWLRKQKIIDCESVKGLFHKDELVVFRELRDEWVVAKVTSVTANDGYRFLDRVQLAVECKAIDFDGQNFRYHQYHKEISKFSGTRNITELEIYPLEYYMDQGRRTKLLKDSIDCGRRWYEMHQDFVQPTQQITSDKATQEGTEPRRPRTAVMHYSGYCETFEEDPDRDENGKGCQLDSRVIVDPSRYPNRRLRFTDDNTNPFLEDPKQLSSTKEDNPLVLCPESVLVHSLSDNQWYLVAMARLEPPVWAEKAWDRLIKPQQGEAVSTSIDRIRRLAKAHQEAKKAAQLKEDSKNNFRGKGKGLTFLLHGPPGVGKTMLAECLSEDNESPLYRINLGQLVTKKDNWESEIDEIFRQAHEWDAILLVDEAEVILAERTQENMTQSAWVADPAFISRVNLGFRIPPLNYETRRRIWEATLLQLSVADVQIKGLSHDSWPKSINEWAKKDLNGRQIRNIIHSTRLLTANSRSEEEIKKNIEDAIDDVMSFKEMVKSEQDEEEKIQLRNWS
ncbi:hypothetical protein N0V82_009862 [Gnomoniopsis sp. IMI 355080]|nr:hypothetical protein N0V82_009862 [Gnomoniopsis sp. IMI 355080]